MQPQPIAQLLGMNPTPSPEQPTTGQQQQHIDQSHFMTLLRHLPGMMQQQQQQQQQHHQLQQQQQQQNNYPDPEPGSSSGRERPGRDSSSADRHRSPYDGQGNDDDYQGDDFDGDGSGRDSPKAGGKRKRKAEHGSEEWARQRKDNHKEVERRRRGNINEGITELGRIVPNGSGDKAKGAILSRAVQYIHHLKENEARNIEKWTLEKLLMDQAMTDLQSQLEEARNALQEESTKREMLEKELEVLRAPRPS